MTSRALSLLLICVIGLPMCWCCDAHAQTVQTPVPEAEKVCCHAADAEGHESGASHSSTPDDDCPCVVKMNGRDKVAREVALPAGATAHDLPFEMAAGLDLIDVSRVALSPVSLHLPPLVAGLGRPLYQQHCRLLL